MGSTQADQLPPDLRSQVGSVSHLEILASSGVFQTDYYLKAYPDLASLDMDPLLHFYYYGIAEGRRPNAYFDSDWYLKRYTDVAEAGVNPLIHYILHGDAEGRQPSLLFNPAWYRRQVKVPNGETALGHYLKNCRLGTVSPIPEFDIHYYAKYSPDVIAAGIDPFEHYVSHGYTEGRAPSDDFDVRFYTRRYLGEEDSAVNPFIHWLQNRDTPGVYGRMPDHETTIPREVRRFTQPSKEFEEFRPLPASARRQAKILAFYLPQFHSFAENDAWWGRGFTEWTNLPRGLPRFRGHYQPRVPRDLGFYGLTDHDGTETMRRQVKIATDAGLFGFVFYYYWFNGKRLMDRPIERLLKDSTIDIPFALMWANENWTRRWDGAESEVLISQDYRPDDDEAMLRDFDRHFKDRRYIRLEGRPLLMIYRPGLIPNSMETIARWRDLCQSEFNENPIIMMAQSFGDLDPTSFGLDGAIEFPPHKLTQTLTSINHQIELIDPEFQGKVYEYDAVVKQSLTEPATKFPLIKTVVPSWDNDARRQGTGLVLTNSSPKKYQAWLSGVIALARKRPIFGEAIVCINAWNEWCEGAYLEPDLHFGSAYLNATSRACVGMGNTDAASYKVLLIGHDAFPSGAQQLLIDIGRTLLRKHGVTIEFLLLEGGKLVANYSDVAPTKVVTNVGLNEILIDYASRGFVRAILNTSVCGHIAASLETNGISPEIMLVHELPRLLREKQLIPSLTGGFQFARNVIFPARFVKDAVVQLIGKSPSGNSLVVPQGSYKVLAPLSADIDAFRNELKLDPTDSLVLGVGYADLRKGFDLFLQVWRLVNREHRVHFCWAGSLAPELEAWLGDEVVDARTQGTFHLSGFVHDMGPVFGASAILLVPSREDPFPSVVMEALSLGKPVIAFSNSGGIPEILIETGAGVVVPYADTVGMANSVKAILKDPDPEHTIELRRTLVREKYSFPRYVEQLLAISLPEMATISVAVPNYNYARYLPERLSSIFRQSHPVHEVIVLDDGSSDTSLDVIRDVAADWNRDISVISSAVNSGSVFDQWRKAAELASGEWIWIAEADDTSDMYFLSQIMSVVNGDSQVVMAFSDSRTVDEDGADIWDSYKSYYSTVEKDALTKSDVFSGTVFVSRFLAIKNLILNVSAVVWRRDALLTALHDCTTELKSYEVAGDWHLYLHALSAPGAKIAFECRNLNVHRRHSKSVTSEINAERHLSEIKRCHRFAQTVLGKLNDQAITAQEAYIVEVAKQFGMVES